MSTVWYAKYEGVYFLGFTSIFKEFENFSKTAGVHWLVCISRQQFYEKFNFLTGIFYGFYKFAINQRVHFSTVADACFRPIS